MLYKGKNYLLGAMTLLLVVGCAGQLKESTPEETVARLSQQRLNALLDGDVVKAYNYTSPAYRSGVSIERYRPHVAGAGSWTSAVIDDVSCEEQVCKVRSNITYQTAFMKGELPSQITEKWVNIDGKWWYYQH